ncbi:MAG: hypothetical protein FWE94_08280 [Coriobacteriia bacterium]|nr:hypothetical protein [Coriobacteriia bacterium]
MTYKRVEHAFLLTTGGIVIGCMLFWKPSGTSTTSNFVAQILLFIVLLAGVRFGPRGGLIATTTASAAFVVFTVLESASPTLSSHDVFVVLLRLLAFGGVGIIGGETFARLRYHLATIGGENALDELSNLYNQRYLAASLNRAFFRYARYGENFSVVIVSFSPATLLVSSATKRRFRIRQIADYIRSNVRVVDEVGRLEDGRFLVILPHTNGMGAAVVAANLTKGISTVLPIPADEISMTPLSLPNDTDDLRSFMESLAPEAFGQETGSGT